MKYLVLSDTHGKTNQASHLYQQAGDFDGIIHLGDYERDARTLEAELGTDVFSVKGNMDGGVGELHRILETEGGKIFLTHGHREDVKSSLQRLLYKTEEEGCKAALFGHTHEPYCGEFGDLILFNPGSLTLPRAGRLPSYGILEIKNGELHLSLAYCQWAEEVENSPKKTDIQGGYLKNLLNNSDRF